MAERTVRTYNVTTAHQPKRTVVEMSPFNQPSSSGFTSNTSAPPPVQTASPYNVTTPFNQPSSSGLTSNTNAPPPYCETDAPPPYCEANMTED